VINLSGKTLRNGIKNKRTVLKYRIALFPGILLRGRVYKVEGFTVNLFINKEFTGLTLSFYRGNSLGHYAVSIVGG